MAKKTKTMISVKDKRNAIRFRPDEFTLAYFSVDNGSVFKPKYVALVINESYTGCSIVLNSNDKFKLEQKLLIKVGELAPMKAQFVWIKKLEEDIIKAGVRFLE